MNSNKKLWICIILILTIAGILLFGSHSRRLSTPAFIGLIFLANFIPVYFFLFPIMKQNRLRKRLLKSGLRGIATVVLIEDTSITLNKNPYVRIHANIQTETESFSAIFEALVSRVQIPRVGDKLDVYVDPSDKNLIVLA